MTGAGRPDKGDFDCICKKWTPHQREKSILCNFIRYVAAAATGERDILVIYCMGAKAAYK